MNEDKYKALVDLIKKDHDLFKRYRDAAFKADNTFEYRYFLGATLALTGLLNFIDELEETK